jgi:predicted lipid-binding transport protein (Tim44 family)
LSAFISGFIYVHTSADGLPWWSIAPLTLLGYAIAIGLLRGIAFLVSEPGERRLRRRVAAVHAAAGAAGPYSPNVVQAAATRLFADVQTAWDAGDRARLQQLSDSDLMADWAKRLDGYRARGKRQRIKVVKGPKVQYVSLRADRDIVRVRIRAKVRRRFEPARGPRKDPRFGWSYSFEEFWTFALRGGEWIVFSTRPTKFRKEFTTEPIMAPGAATVTRTSA